jgi:hypothetical protein
MAGGTATVLMGGYWTRAERLSISSRLAKFTKSQRLMMLWRLPSYDTHLEGLAQDLQAVAAELQQFIQKKHPMVRPRHLAGHRHVAAADQADIGDRVMGGPVTIVPCLNFPRAMPHTHP